MAAEWYGDYEREVEDEAYREVIMPAYFADEDEEEYWCREVYADMCISAFCDC